MAVYTFNDNFKINAPKHIDTRYINLFTPYVSTAAANAAIVSAYRYLGLTVLIGTVEYWYQSGIADINLVPKLAGGGTVLVTADNGLTAGTPTASNVRLGGTLAVSTTINQVTHPITFSGAVTSSTMFNMTNILGTASGNVTTLNAQANTFGGNGGLTAITGFAGGINNGVNIGGNFEGNMGTGGSATQAYGVYAQSDAGIGVYGASLQNIGVLGALTSGSGGIAVKGDAQATTGIALYGITSGNGIGLFAIATGTGGTAVQGEADGTGPSSIAISGNATGDGSIAGEFIATNYSVSTVVPNTIFIRTTSGTAAIGLGQSLDLYAATSTGGAPLCNQLISKWTNATFGAQTSLFSITGAVNAATTTLMDINGTTANFYGVGGSSISAIGGQLGATLTGSVTGVLATGSTPIWATNPSTVTNTIVDGILIQRNGTYNGAAGVGLQIRMEAKNSVGTIVTATKIIGKFTTATSGAEIGQIDLVVDIASTYVPVLAVCGRNTGVVNIQNIQNFANNAAAITGGLVVGDLYRNGDVLQIVH